MDAQVPKNDAPGARRPLLESLASLGRAAFDPSGTDRAAAQQQFHDLLRRTPPVALLPALNVLIQPNRGAPAWLQTEYMRQLALLPLRADDGVRATLEFVFAMHPSSAAAAEAEAAAAGPAAGPGGGGGKSTTPQKQGAHITQEALQMATRLLASPPAATPADAWFRGIAPQLLALLDGRDGLELAKVASYVIGFGILGRKSFGAPGKPGWANFAEPMLRCIDPQLRQGTDDDDKDRVVELRRNAAAVLVSDADVAQGLRRLQTLVLSHPNPGLARRLLGPVVLPLWALSTWSGLSAQGEEAYGLPARNLLKIYLRIAPSPDKVLPIARDLLYNGARDAERAPPWTYESVEDGPAAADTSTGARPNTSRICIVSAPSTPLSDLDVLQTRWHEIGPKADALVDLLASIAADDEEISAVFLSLFGRWLASRGKPSIGGDSGGDSGGGSGVVLVHEEEDDQNSSSSPLQAVLEGSLLQKMMERFPEKLAGRPDHILALVAGILAGTETAHDAGDSETLPVVLSLLNLVVMAPGFRRVKVDAAQLQAIEDGLARVGAQTAADDGAAAADTAKTAQNLLLLLRYKDELDDADAMAKGAAGKGPAAADPQQEQRQQARQKRLAEDRKTQSLALAYITQADAPPPVRSEGLSLLQGLVQANSAVLDIPALLVLLSSLLGGDEDYINLRVMRLFVAVAERHPRATTRELLEHYVDVAETRSVDTRLRFGEALLQVVQRLGETFAGETAQAVGAALLETAGRRPQRPKTAAKQARAEKLAEMKRKRAAEQGEDEEEDDDDDEEADEEEDEADRQRNAILRGIVDGWGSRRGSEDVRIRASALSVLATAVDTNVAGLGGPLASAAVDLALHVLTLEAGPGRLDRAILRRAAIVLVLSFVRALDAAAQHGRRLGFGLTPQSQAAILRILRYVAGTDEDGLVRQHAHDAIESLEAWQVSAMLPAGDGDDGDGNGAPMLPPPGSQLPRLAGLSLNPAKVLGGTGGGDDAASAATQVRPRIEEVE